jgi:hypothetical protein|nr:MAG TPA: hypothetical protein [Caudoviricetes sp.]
MNSDVIQKIADMFQVSFEKATELYPLIRTQYTIYTIFDFIGEVLIGLLLAALIFGGMYFFMKSQDYELSDTDEETLAFKSLLKLFLKVILALGLLIITIYVLRTVLAPDISFIRDILK